MMKIDLESLAELALDLSTFPKCTLEFRNKGEYYVHKVTISNHEEGKELFNQINAEWHKILKERQNDK